jgi:hypothetical protein
MSAVPRNWTPKPSANDRASLSSKITISLREYVNAINPFEMQISLSLGKRSISSTGEYLKVDDARSSKAIADA